MDLDHLTKTTQGADFVFHLSANADIRFGTQHPQKESGQNTFATFHMPGDAPFPVQTSLYGASKLGGEGLMRPIAIDSSSISFALSRFLVNAIPMVMWLIFADNYGSTQTR